MKIGILYNLVENIERGLEIDKLSDNEIIDTVNNVKRVLDKDHEVIPVRINRDLFSRLSSKSFDFVFNFCEGIDGNVQGEPWIPAIFDMIGIKYTGSDSFTLGLCLDKIKTKQLLIANNIPTPKYKVFYNLSDSDMRDSDRLDLSGSDLKFPLIVKPSHEDASIGISSDSVVNNEHDLLKRADYILKTYNQPALVEEYIDGRELSAAVVGNGNSVDVMPVSEILFDFDKDVPRIDSYESKWIKDSYEFKKTDIICPAEFPEDVGRRIKKLALDSYNITGCKDYAVVDFRLKDDDIYVIEINPNPSIGVKTGFAAAAENKGLSYKDLVYRIFSEAVKRYGLNVWVSEKKDVTDIKYKSPSITAGRVRLEHMPLLMKWFNEPETIKYMDSPEGLYNVEELIESFMVLNQEDINLIIYEKESKKEIGYCSLYNIRNSNKSAEISFLIDSEFRGKGYGKEVIKILLSTAFDNTDLNSVFATVTQKNERSLKVFARTGFRRIGLMREYHYINGEKLDEIFFEMLRSDYVRLYKNQ